MRLALPTDRIVLILLLAALALRLAAMPVGLRMAERRGIRFYDEYGGIAQNIVAGHGFSYAWGGPLRPTSIHAPVYPFLLAGVFGAVGEERAAPVVIALNILISLVLLWLVHRFLLREFGRGAALVGLAILALLPTQAYYSASGLPTVLYTTGLCLVIGQAWRTRRDPSVRNAVVWGLLIGFCALSYSFVVVLAPWLVLWLLVTVSPGRRLQAVRVGLVAGLVAIVVCIPWTVRNHQVHGRWILIRDQAGINLWWGNNPDATGGAMDRNGVALGALPPDARVAMEAIDNEVDADRYMGKLARRQMLDDPGRTLGLWVRKIGMFWWFAPGERAVGSGVSRVMPLLKLAKLLLLAAAAAGMVLLARRCRALFLLVMTVCLAITFVHMVFHAGNIRYFFPLEPVLAVPAAVAVAEFLRRRWPWFRRLTPDETANP